MEMVRIKAVHPRGNALGWVGAGWHPSEILHRVGRRVHTRYPSQFARVSGVGYRVFYKKAGTSNVLIPTYLMVDIVNALIWTQ